MLIEANENLLLQLTYWTVGLAVVLTLVITARHARRSRAPFGDKENLKAIAQCMGLWFAASFVTHLYTFVAIHDKGIECTADYLLRSLAHALSLFFFDIDGDLMSELYKHTPLRALIMALTLVCFALTMAMVVSLLVTRLRQYLRLRLHARFGRRPSRLYLFFGLDGQAASLAADIARHDPRATIVLIDSADQSDEEKRGSTLMRLIGQRTHAYASVRRTRAYMAVADARPCDVAAAAPAADLLRRLGLADVRRLVQRLPREARLDIFLLGDDTQEVLANFLALTSDVTLRQAAARLPLTFSVEARHSAATRALHSAALKEHIGLRIIDPARLAVDLLKATPELHPVRVAHLSTSQPLTVSQPFEALIVGLGPTGRDAFRFVYEFTALVAEGSTPTDVRRAPLHVTLVDPSPERLPGHLGTLMPAIFGPVKPQGVTIDTLAATPATLALPPSTLEKLNYVVIALPHADEAIALTASLYEQIRRHRTDLSHLRIVVRATDPTATPILQRIADRYNADAGAPVIHLFGLPREVYTFDIVVKARFERMARRFYAAYAAAAHSTETYDERHQRLSQTLDEGARLRRQESQDFANVMHMATKTYLYASAPQLPADARREMLARTEHMRWQAAHELMGYQTTSELQACDERRRLHPCITPYQNLAEHYRDNDRRVVDITLQLDA